MAKRSFRPEDAYLLKTAADPDLAPDGRLVAWTEIEADKETDHARTSIWVAALDGSSPPRRFTEGPADSSPRWSPDSRFLAYVSAPAGEPFRAHVRLAPLDGGVPLPLGELSGPVSQPAWSPDSTRLVVVCRIGARSPGDTSATDRNAPRLVRGLAARLDGVGWQEGRRQLFVIDVGTGTATQLTRGEFDHADPSWSPDGRLVAFASDRDRRHDDRQFRSDAWVVPALGGRPRRLTHGEGRVSFPAFAPDGSRIAFAGHRNGESWNSDLHAFTLGIDAGAEPEMVAPATDRGLMLMPGMPAPFRWTGNSEISLLLADRGSVTLHTANLSRRSTREAVGGDRQIDGFAAGLGGRAVAFTASWPDRPSEVWTGTLRGGEPRQLTHFNDDFLASVELGPVARCRIERPDSTPVEYFTITPPHSTRSKAGARLPVHLDIHGGPHGLWPSGRFLAFHQTIAAAGYAVVLPNPRGSTSYGQEFTQGCTGDWGGADYEDILACCDDFIERGAGDGSRMFVSGGSYGGFMTSWIVGHSKRFRAATAMAAVIEQTSMALTTEIPDFSCFNFGGVPWDRPDEYRKRSPLTYLPDVETPVLVVHWEGDLRVPISQGEELYAGLRLLGKEVEFVRYPGGFHIYRTPSQSVDWVKRVLEWNERHDPAGHAGKT